MAHLDNGGLGPGGGLIQPASGTASPGGAFAGSNAMVPMNSGGGGTISLSMLLDFFIQRAYHELMVLGELLPRKTDMERKVNICQVLVSRGGGPAAIL